MDWQEVLIHVAAPSRFHDDTKYQRLADEITRFEVATVTHVHGFVGLDRQNSRPKSSTEAKLSFYQSTSTHAAQLHLLPILNEAAADLQTQAVASSGTRYVSPPRHPMSMISRTQESRSVHEAERGVPDHVSCSTPENYLGRERSLEMDRQGRTFVKSKWMGQWQVRKGRISKTKLDSNPPFKNPFHGPKQSDATAQHFRTPELIRPRTAPAGGIGSIQVPRTLNQEHKRSASDSFLDSSFSASSTIPETQFAIQDVDGSSQGCQRAVGHERAATAPPEEASSTSKLHRHSQPARRKRRRLSISNMGDLIIIDEAKHISQTDANPTAEVFEDTFEQRYLMRPPAGCSGPFFLRDRSEDWTSQPEPSTSDVSSNAISSTLSLSQPLALRLSQTSVSPTSVQPSPVDLVSNTPSEEGILRIQRNVRKQPSTGRPSSQCPPCLSSDLLNSSPESATSVVCHNSCPSAGPPRSQRTCSARSASAEHSNTDDFTSSIKSLPDRIEAPPPPTGSGLFITHVSDPLSTMVSRLPLVKYFRPVQVSRDVRMLERGHWLIRVKIAGNKDVAEARRPPSQEKVVEALQKQTGSATSTRSRTRRKVRKAAGNDPNEMAVSKRCDLWTEDEFINFWEVLTKYVEDGKAGHGLSVVKDWADKGVTPGPSTQSTYARIRIYSWGEVVGHLWIALWVLSDKKTAYLPMEWIATDDSVVVRMSGNRYKGGRLGPWVPKGSPSGKGSWGIDEGGTPPGNQSKYAGLPSS